MAKEQSIWDTRPIGEKASLEDILRFGANALVDASVNLVKGTVNMVGDLADGCQKVCKGDFDGAGEVARNRVQNIISSGIGSARSGAKIVESVYESVVHDKDFFTAENQALVTNFCQGVFAVAGVSGTAGFFDPDMPEGTTCPLDADCCRLPGVENGVLSDNSPENVQILIDAGTLEGGDHVPSSEVSRNVAVKADFLDAHGIEDTEGWEVHHIVPLSEGGEDSITNMVLVDKETHGTITQAQAEHYGWHR